MSRLTGNEVQDLMEAYSEVYAPQEELTEEQIWESAEIWVYECIENGVDFSEYTLDELTEAFLIDYGYLSEDSAGRAGRDFGAGARQLFGSARRAVGGAIANTVRGAADVAGATLQGYTGTRTTSSNPLAQAGNLATRAVTAPARFGLRAAQGFVTGQGSTPPSRPAAAPQRQGPPVPDRLRQQPKAPGSGGPPIRPVPGDERAPAPSARPAAPAPSARPAAPAPSARPAAPAPSAAGTQKPAPASTSTLAAPVKTPNPLMQRTFGYQTGNSPKEQQARADKIVQSGAVKALAPSTTTPAPKAATPSLQQSIRNRRLNMDFDPFDAVIGHLLDEGYADTEEQAIAIMANMSEEWRQSILMNEGVLGAVGKVVGGVVKKVGNYLNSPSNDPDLKRDPSYNPRTGRGDYKDPRRQPPRAGEVRTY
jgi:hypothetical protein